MILAIVAVIALASLGISLGLALRLQALEGRLRAMSSRPLQPAAGEVPGAVSPLAGRRVALAIVQDHPYPVFAELLKEQLLKLDAAEVSLLAREALDAWDGDILIQGTLTCNGYTEVYYQAEFTCSSRGEAVCVVMERPPGGDRPGNLAIELLSKLSAKLDDLARRGERQQAMRELGG